jgi:UDP-glucose 4-epimerase
MRALINGGAGFIGSHLSDELRSGGVIGVHFLDDLSTGAMDNVSPPEGAVGVQVHGREPPRTCL